MFLTTRTVFRNANFKTYLNQFRFVDHVHEATNYCHFRDICMQSLMLNCTTAFSRRNAKNFAQNELTHAQYGQIRFRENCRERNTASPVRSQFYSLRVCILQKRKCNRGKFNRVTHVQPSVFRRQNFSQRISSSSNQVGEINIRPILC